MGALLPMVASSLTLLAEKHGTKIQASEITLDIVTSTACTWLFDQLGGWSVADIARFYSILCATRKAGHEAAVFSMRLPA